MDFYYKKTSVEHEFNNNYTAMTNATWLGTDNDVSNFSEYQKGQLICCEDIEDQFRKQINNWKRSIKNIDGDEYIPSHVMRKVIWGIEDKVPISKNKSLVQGYRDMLNSFRIGMWERDPDAARGYSEIKDGLLID